MNKRTNIVVINKLTLIIIVYLFIYFFNITYVYAQNTEEKTIYDLNLLSYQQNNKIGVLSLRCPNADFRQIKITCTSFDLTIKNERSDEELSEENKKRWLRGLDRMDGVPFCEAKIEADLKQFSQIYKRILGGEEVRVKNRIITKVDIEKIFLDFNTSEFKQMGLTLDDWVNIFEKIEFYCDNNGEKFIELLRVKANEMWENSKSLAELSVWRSDNPQVYEKDLSSGNYFSERTSDRRCLRIFGRQEIIIDQEGAEWNHYFIKGYKEIVKVIKQNENTIKCQEEAEKFNYTLEWKANQYFTFPKYWKELHIR